MTTGVPPTIAAVPAPARTSQRVTLARVVRSELTKLRSLRSTVWSLLTAAALIVGIGALYCSLRAANWPPRNPADAPAFDPAAVSVTGVYLAQFAIGALGALLITGEYATGAIRTSFVAVPRRLPVLWAKAIAFALTTPALCLPATLAAFLVGQSILSSKHIGTTLDQPGVARAVIGGALYLTAVGLLGLGLGALTRNAAAAITSLIGLLFLLPIMVGFLPSPLEEQLSRYLPMNAGTVILNARPDPAGLGPWPGLGLFCLYTAAVLALAAWRLRRSDA